MKAKVPFIPLAEAATFMGGSTPSRVKPEFFGGSIPWVKTTDLTNGHITSTEETLSELGLKKSSCKMVPRGAVLVAMYGGFNQIGRTGLLTFDSAINQALTAVIAKPGKLDPLFLLEWLNYRIGYWKKLAGSSRKDPNITKADVAAFHIPNIPIEQQQSCSLVLTEWNRAIEKTKNLIEAKKTKKIKLAKQLLFGKARLRKHSTPLVTLSLKDVTTELKERNSAKLGVETIMGVNKVHGLIPMKEDIIGPRVDRYKVVPPMAFAYNPMRINIGSIAMSQYSSDVLVSPDYVVFKCLEDRSDPDFLNQYRRTQAWENYVKGAGNGSVRIRIYYDELSAMKMELPSLEEQKDIAQVLRLVDKEIELTEKSLNAIKKQKRGLMQKLLTGEWRVKAD